MRPIRSKSSATKSPALSGNMKMDKAKAGGRNSNSPLKMGFTIKKTLVRKYRTVKNKY